MNKTPKKCICGSEPRLVELQVNPNIYRITCDCGKTSHGELEPHQTIKNWNDGYLKPQ